MCVCVCLKVLIMEILWHYIHIYVPDIGMMVKMFANGPGDLGLIPGRVIPKT